MVDLAQKARDIHESIIIERENEAEKKGFEIGVEIGFEIGFKQGGELGKLEVARELKIIGFSDRDIINVTELSSEQVEDLD